MKAVTKATVTLTAMKSIKNMVFVVSAMATAVGVTHARTTRTIKEKLCAVQRSKQNFKLYIIYVFYNINIFYYSIYAYGIIRTE
jgi:hypothetical protein